MNPIFKHNADKILACYSNTESLVKGGEEQLEKGGKGSGRKFAENEVVNYNYHGKVLKTGKYIAPYKGGKKPGGIQDDYTKNYHNVETPGGFVDMVHENDFIKD